MAGDAVKDDLRDSLDSRRDGGKLSETGLDQHGRQAVPPKTGKDDKVRGGKDLGGIRQRTGEDDSPWRDPVGLLF